MAKDFRSPEAAEYRKLYRTTGWQGLRIRVFIRDNYTCQNPRCGRICAGKYPALNSPAADHIKAHKGDIALFLDEANVQTLCKACHDVAKQRAERQAYQPGCDVSGRPIDASHPWNRKRA